MLTKQQKLERFKVLRDKNYRASLQLEGFDVEPSKVNVEVKSLTEAEQITKLKQRYAR
ncbi:YhfG family protein [uncultured Photobacterium sp.]|uniref:YhfG family protein n=1 Tax=uncultured Photobacterium sp. TaxID=173973 RepID=UPI002605E133|nr:YhfG family protein [uncultured Photobacterium sp.]